MTKPRPAKPKQGAASRGLELVGLIRGVPTPEQVDELARALCAAANAAAGPSGPTPRPKRAKRRKRDV